MSKLSRGALIGMWIGVGCAVLCVLATGTNPATGQPPATQEAAEPAPPAGQTYTGSKQCASCHFKQFMTWKKTKHATDAWTKVAAKYRADAKCLPCHSTGYGQATGFKDETSTAALVGTGCEACHGPGSEHDKVAKQFATKKKLAPEEEKLVRDSIYKVLPGNVCTRCHDTQGHKEHPKYDK